MLGYLHNTTKIWRIWNFNAGRNGRAVECSSVVFQEQENAHGKSTEKPAEGIEFPETAAELNNETHEVEETDMMEMNNSSRLQDSKSKKNKKIPHYAVVTSELARILAAGGNSVVTSE